MLHIPLCLHCSKTLSSGTFPRNLEIIKNDIMCYYEDDKKVREIQKKRP